MTQASIPRGRPIERPPVLTVGPLAWVRENLFRGWGNTLLTFAILGMAAVTIPPTIEWIVNQARWEVISRNALVIVFGRYPREELGRPLASLGILVALGAASTIAWASPARAKSRRRLVWLWLLSPVVFTLLLAGFDLPTPATIANHLGYYLFRPDVLPQLEQAWRGPAALAWIAVVAGMSWIAGDNRIWKGLSLGGVIALAALNLPLSLQSLGPAGGSALPRIVAVVPLGVLGWIIGTSLGRRVSNLEARQGVVAAAWAVSLPAAFILLTHFDVGIPSLAPRPVLTEVQPAIWSGIMLTVILSVVSIVASFPIGVLLALGRRSGMPVVRGFSILVIEIVRGVPLISVLFMAQVMLPLFLPLDLTIDRVVRAMAGMTLFTAAYLAEVVRGGLQAVRHEQVEAARALGLSEVLVTGLVVLPQALRAVIPAIMGQFVSVFKDTTLVTIVGLLDLVGILQSVIKQREFVGAVREVYLFAAVFFFVFSYAMSYASRRLEVRLGVGQR